MGHSDKDLRSNTDGGSQSSQSRKSRGSFTGAHTVTSSQSGTNQSATLNTALGLSQRRVTMMSINIAGYHATLCSKDNSKISRIQSELVTAISSACSEHRGVLDGFQGDRFLASFNAVTNVGNHSLQAAYAAHTACRTADTMRTPLVMTAGLASGSALVGNMGSMTIKRFTILGHVVSTAVTLERLAKRHRTGGGVLAGGVAITDLENFFDVLTVDAAVLPISTVNALWRTRIAAVMSPKSTASEEWMYELKEGSAKSRYGDANLAFAAFLEGNQAEASRIVEHVCDGKHDPDSTSVGEALKKLMCAEPAVDGKRYVSPMTDFYLQCVLPNGNTAATNMSHACVNSLNSSHNVKRSGSSVLMDKCSGDGVCVSSLIGSPSGSVLEIESESQKQLLLESHK